MVGRRVALLVATDRYQDTGLSSLAAPASDAERLAAVLGDIDIAGFEVTTLYNEPHYVVGRAIGNFYRDRRGDDLTLLYFTGHGVKDQDGRLYLAMTDTDRENLPFTGVPSEQIRAAMDGSRSRQKVLILDCCYAGAFPAGLGVKGDPSVHALEQLGGRGCVVLTSSDAMQLSFEGNHVTQTGPASLRSGPSSLFTRFLIKGLRTGKADLDGDGDITLDELYSYVHDRVIDEQPLQRPKIKEDIEGRIRFAQNVNWTVPSRIIAAVNSTFPPVKLGALEELHGLYYRGNVIVKQRVLETVRLLAEDDSKNVSGAASQFLSELILPEERRQAARPEAEAAARREAEEAARREAEAAARREAEEAARREAEEAAARREAEEAARCEAIRAETEVPAAVLVTESDSLGSEAGDKDESLAPMATLTAAVKAGEADGPAADLAAAVGPGAAVGEPGCSATGPDMAADVPGVAMAGREAPLEWDVASDAAEGPGVPVADQRGLPISGPSSGGAPPAPPSRRDIFDRPGAITVRGRRRGRRLLALALGGAIIAAAGVTSFMLLNSPVKPQGPLTSPSVPSLQFRPVPSSYSGDNISSLAFSPSGTTLAIADNPADHRKICLWDIAAKTCIAMYMNATSVAFSPDGKLLAAVDVNGSVADNENIRLWTVATGQFTPLPNPKSLGAYSVACSPDDLTLAAADENGYTYLWNVVTHKMIGRLPGPQGWRANSVAFSSDGKRLAVGYENGYTYLWDAVTPKLIDRLPGPQGKSANSVAFSSDGKLLAVGYADGSTYLWSAVTDKPIAHLHDSQGQSAYSVAFSPDNRLLAVGDTDGKIYVWNVAARKWLPALGEPNSGLHPNSVNSVVFSPSGKILAAGYSDGSVYLWYISSRLSIVRISADGSESVVALAEQDEHVGGLLSEPGGVTRE